MKPLERNPEIVWRTEKRRQDDVLEAMARGEDVADRGTVILMVGGMMHQLNFVGGLIWTLCDGTRSCAGVVDELAREFEVDREELTADVEEFVADLTGRGWLRHG